MSRESGKWVEFQPAIGSVGKIGHNEYTKAFSWYEAFRSCISRQGKLNPPKKYSVFVRDNFHHMDVEEEYLFGEFESASIAVSVMEGIIDRYFNTRSTFQLRILPQIYGQSTSHLGTILIALEWISTVGSMQERYVKNLEKVKFDQDLSILH